jgi:general stress protein YciG
MNALSEGERQELPAKAGKRGGKARARALSPEHRSRIARKAALEM